jgi:YD repeat-containing protein
VNSSFGYGQDGRLATVSHTGADWQASGALVRDKEGRIVSIDRNISGIEVPAVNFSGKAEEYAYTANNRVEGREYDGRGNVVRSGGLTFVWDGRNLARTISAAADSVSMEWDAFGRLIRIGPKRVIWNYAVNPPALATIIEETPPAGAAGARRYLKWHSNSGPPGDYVEYPTPAGDEQRLIGESVSSVLRLLPLMLMYFELGGKAEFHEAGPRRESLLCPPVPASQPVAEDHGSQHCGPEQRNFNVLVNPASFVTEGFIINPDGRIVSIADSQDLNVFDPRNEPETGNDQDCPGCVEDPGNCNCGGLSLEEKCDGCLIDLREWHSADQEYVQSVDAILKERGVSTDLLTAADAPIQIFRSAGAGGISNTLFASPPPAVLPDTGGGEAPDRIVLEMPKDPVGCPNVGAIALPLAIVLAIPRRRKKR